MINRRFQYIFTWHCLRFSLIWKCIQKMKHRNISLMIILSIFSVSLWAILKYFSIFCTQWEIQKATKMLCQLYAREVIDGNLCYDLCNHNIKVGDCQPFHLGKEVVFQARWKNQDVVIKSQYLNLDDYEDLKSREYGILHNISLEEFQTILYNKLKSGFNIALNNSYKQNDISALWHVNFKNIAMHSEKKFTAMVNSIWSLIQQDEYVLFKLFETKHIFPKIMGSCGHFYAVEHEVPLRSLNPNSNFLQNYTFESILEIISLRFPNLIDTLENGFHETLHLCDIKFDHFGIDKDFHIKILDADTAFFHSRLINMLQITHCLEDVDCTFWDCKAICHPQKKICTNLINNNNEIICQKILQSKQPFLAALFHQIPILFTKNSVTFHLCNFK